MHHRRIRRLALLAAVVGALAIAAPAGAITHGQLDGDDHPYVGELFFHDPDAVDPRFTDPGAWFSCSGTLISPTVVLTAGHCTFALGHDGESTRPGGWGGNDTWISFDPETDFTGIAAAPFIPDDNAGRYAHYRDTLNASSSWHRGTAYPHPDYDDGEFFLADAGVVILDEPVDLDEYGVLAGRDYLDQFTGRAKTKTSFTAVGFGFTRSLPIGDAGGDIRMTSNQVIVNANGVYGVHDNSSIVFSNNNGTPHRGGTCSGDSGGPFLRGGTNIVVAVNSYAQQPNCTGGDGGYRIDQRDDVEWLDLVLRGADPRF